MLNLFPQDPGKSSSVREPTIPRINSAIGHQTGSTKTMGSLDGTHSFFSAVCPVFEEI